MTTFGIPNGYAQQEIAESNLVAGGGSATVQYQKELKGTSYVEVTAIAGVGANLTIESSFDSVSWNQTKVTKMAPLSDANANTDTITDIGVYRPVFDANYLRVTQASGTSTVKIISVYE